MFAQIEYPEKLLPEALDNYLACGWFRMRQTIFTTNFLHFNRQFYSAIWLRVELNQSIQEKKYLALNKLNKDFKTEIIPSGIDFITPEHEALYQCYRQSISFDVSASLRELLFGIETFNRFDTWVVNIYDGDSLIAAGFFDMGKNSAAGISSIYHPAYKKHSLGKYLVYKKMEFCQQQQLEYFYPGYVVPGYSPFNYKLELGKAGLQYLQLSSQQWQPYTALTPMQNPLQDMVEKLSVLQLELAKDNFQTILLYYRFFEANLDPYFYGQQLFDFPVFLNCIPAADGSFTMIVFDVQSGKYQLLQCNSVIHIGVPQEGCVIFDTDILRVEQDLFSTENSDEIISCLYEFSKA